jgi:NADH dehydrogenase
MSKKILVLGGGFAGMYAARELRRQFGEAAQIEVINQENYFVFQPLLPEVAAGSIAPTHAVSPLRFLLKGVFVRKARIESVDFDRKIVTVFQGVQRRPTEVAYDHLVIALGQSVDLSRMPGLSEHALTMKTLEDARRLRAHVIEKLEHAEITQLPEVKRGALTFTVIGGGFSGIETVGELKELIDRSLRFYPHIDPAEVRVVVLEFAPRILGEMPEKLADYAWKHLTGRRGIEIQLGTGVQSATGTQLVTTAGEVIDTRTIVATIGNAPSKLVGRLDLPLRHGRVAVERTLQVEGRDDVWSLGDCALIPMKDGAEARDDFAPPTAQFAVREARRLARNIRAAADGKPLTPFAYESQGALASLGARRGVAEVWGVNITGYPAWLLWRLYYLAFLPGLGTKARVLVNWILDGLSPRSVVHLRADTPPSMSYALYRAGDRIYEKGNRADGVYTVISGAVEVIDGGPDAAEAPRRRAGPGDHFGERIIFGETRRATTVRALEDTRVLVIDREAFLKLADGFAPFQEYFRDRLRDRHGVEWAPPRNLYTDAG